ncbi:MAG: DegV family protein [Clostridiales bacterium]|nr:DegV family protein [Clostridiales bacterium]
MSFKVTCESCADLNTADYKKHNISVLPFSIILGDNEFKDGINITNADLFDFAEKSKILPKTAALNASDYVEFFKRENTEDEGIIHISLSSKLSSTYEHAVEASKEFDNVYVIDSESLSSGVGLQVLYACSLRDKKTPIKEAVELITNRRSSVQISFVVDKLNYLHKGGRCSAVALLGSNLLGIKPSIVLSSGKMVVGKKYMGKIHKTLDKYVSDTLEEFNTPDKSLCFITYSSATKEMIDVTKNALSGVGFKKIAETTAGCTVATHCGPNTLGIIYYNDGK